MKPAATVLLLLLAIGGVAGIISYNRRSVAADQHLEAVRHARYLLFQRERVRTEIVAAARDNSRGHEQRLDRAQKQLIELETAIAAVPKDAAIEAQRQRLKNEADDALLRR